MFDLLEVLKSNPAFTQPYTLILLALSAGNADQRAFSSGYSGSVSGTPMSGVGPRYSEPGNNGSSGAGRARRFGSRGADVSLAAELDCPTVSVFAVPSFLGCSSLSGTVLGSSSANTTPVNKLPDRITVSSTHTNFAFWAIRRILVS